MRKKIKSNHNKNKLESNPDIYDKIKRTSKSKKEKTSYLEHLSNQLKLPADILIGAPIITSTGMHQVCVENYKGLIEYNHEFIKIQTKQCKVCIQGKNLNIDYYTDDEMNISGKILSIHYQ